jgi:plasmid stabilization system protein ParE
MQVVWTESALRDLASLRAFIARDKPSAADNQVQTVVAAVAGLANFPETGKAGRRRRDAGTGCRQNALSGALPNSRRTRGGAPGAARAATLAGLALTPAHIHASELLVLAAWRVRAVASRYSSRSLGAPFRKGNLPSSAEVPLVATTAWRSGPTSGRAAAGPADRIFRRDA